MSFTINVTKPAYVLFAEGHKFFSFNMPSKSPLPEDIQRRIEEIHTLIFEIANGNYDYRISRSEENDELDGLIGGITMLGEEIKASTVSRNYLRSIYKGVVDLLVVLRQDFTIETVNEQVQTRLGYDSEYLPGKPFQTILSTLHHKKLKKIEADLEKHQQCTNIELNFVHENKATVTYSASFSVLSDKPGGSGSILVIAKDVTEFKETERRLKNQNELLKEIAWIQSHKVRGPVASILGLMRLIDWKNQSPEENMIILQNLQLTAEKLDDIIHEIVAKSGHLFYDDGEEKF